MADTPPNKNNLSKDVEIKGSIKFVNQFVFDGNLEGEISSVDGILTVGENADVRGEVKSKTVIVKGKVHGNITVQERCELHSRSQLIGDLKAARLVIEEGATFVGKSEVTPNKNIIKDLGYPITAERRTAKGRRSTLRSSEWLLKDELKHYVLDCGNIQLEPELAKSTYCKKCSGYIQLGKGRKSSEPPEAEW